MRWLLGLVVAVTAVFVPMRPSASAPAPAAYVALGDSYTSGPLVPMQTGTPIDCGRSDHNYPALAAAALKVAVFRDVSCGQADTSHFTSPQTGLTLGGVNPPQFNALAPDAAIVSVGIGGNDMGLGLAVINCLRFAPPPVGQPPCVDAMTAGGVDQMSREIARTAPKIDAALAAIHRRAPAARVFVVGYPHMFPDSGEGCWPYLPFLPEDVVYFRAKLVELNAMLEARTRAAGDTFVDTYASSVGHDPCQLPGTAWVNGIVAVPLSYVVHPNALQMAETSRLLVAAIRASGYPAPIAAPSGVTLAVTGANRSVGLPLAVLAALGLLRRLAARRGSDVRT